MESINIHFIYIWWANVSLPLHTTGGSCNQHSHTLWIIIYPDNGGVYASTENGWYFFFSLHVFFFVCFFYDKENYWLGNSMTDFLSFLLLGLFRQPLELSTNVIPPPFTEKKNNKNPCHLQDNCHLTILMIWHNNWSTVYYAICSHRGADHGYTELCYTQFQTHPVNLRFLWARPHFCRALPL